MVQFLLIRRRLWRRAAFASALAALLPSAMWAAGKPKPATPREIWEMSLDGGRSLTWQQSFNSESQVKPNRGFWNKLVDVVAGEPNYKFLVRPYSIASDSHGRIIVTDPGASGVHIFDFAQRKYKFIERREKSRDAMLAPQCVAVDAQDNIYITDSDSGKIFVFEPTGKYLRAIGSLKGGEGYFKRPTGIAVDSEAQHIYVTDTLRDQVFVLDMLGNILQTIGKSGQREGEFNLPTELRLSGENLLVVDAMNFRVEAFDRSGKFQYAIGTIGDATGAVFRPKAVSVDSEGDIYIVDAQWGVVQVFNRQGQLLYYFGAKGTHAGEFQLPSGLFIDRGDRVFVVDSFNRRVQVFQYAGLKVASAEAQK
ncbi:MAG TPA: 6-bladed beta-propeller [Terracidiphilus sp.]|nr:6-bladed beta-propeller [Terracidiphilus sp.]